METSEWRKCSSCKKPIHFGAKYYVCSVSTCTGGRTNYVFCSVPCFEVHLPIARHKDAAAIESKAPLREPTRSIVRQAETAQSPSAQIRLPNEILIIASRLKEYVDARSQMNTSAQVMDVLSAHVRNLCDRAIENARADGRKTVLDRDFSFLKRPMD